MALRNGTRNADTLTGTARGDIIIPGRGNDTMTGGDGNDLFVILPGDFNSGDVDTITDFSPGDFIYVRHGYRGINVLDEDVNADGEMDMRVVLTDALGQVCEVQCLGVTMADLENWGSGWIWP